MYEYINNSVSSNAFVTIKQYIIHQFFVIEQFSTNIFLSEYILSIFKQGSQKYSINIL